MMGPRCIVSGKSLLDDYGSLRKDVVRMTVLMLDGWHTNPCVLKEYENDLNMKDLWTKQLEFEHEEHARRMLDPRVDHALAERAHNLQMKLLCPPLGRIS